MIFKNRQWLDCYLQQWKVMMNGKFAWPAGRVFTRSFDYKQMWMRDV